MNIRTEQLIKYFGENRVLQGLDISLRDKEFVGIIGPNGSGKSTFLKCLYRVLQPSSGSIFFDGRQLDEMSFRETALRLAVVAQHNFYSFDFNVLDVVLMGRSPHKKMLERDNAADYAIAREALATVGLAEFEDRSFTTLSGGEQQRVILARALTQQTETLILDEPTNHLDIKFQLEIMDIVKRLPRTVIAAIHDLNIAAMYCDRLIALKDGAVIADGTPQEVLTEEFIYSVYGVRTRIRQEDGLLHIAYLPQHVQVQ